MGFVGEPIEGATVVGQVHEAEGRQIVALDAKVDLLGAGGELDEAVEVGAGQDGFVADDLGVKDGHGSGPREVVRVHLDCSTLERLGLPGREGMGTQRGADEGRSRAREKWKGERRVVSIVGRGVWIGRERRGRGRPICEGCAARDERTTPERGLRACHPTAPALQGDGRSNA